MGMLGSDAHSKVDIMCQLYSRLNYGISVAFMVSDALLVSIVLLFAPEPVASGAVNHG